MAAKKSPKSSKTAHVLNLLSGPPGAEPPADSPAPAIPEAPKNAEPAPEAAPAPPPSPRSLTPPILEVARASSAALSETIHSALEDALLSELGGESAVPPAQAEAASPPEEPAAEAHGPGAAAPPAVKESIPEEPALPADAAIPEIPAAEPEAALPAEEPVPKKAPPEAAFSAAEAALGEEPAPLLSKKPPAEEEPSPPTPPPPPEEPAPEPPSKPALPPPPADPSLLPDGSRLINVMEILVSEKLERYVDMFGLCRCPRCLADVKALALTNLPTKYVVLPAFAESPFMEIYRGRYSSAITAQILYACRMVMENPRHTLET